MSNPNHRWSFFRAGGFNQVKLQTGEDLINLRQLDQKLWVALACPISGLEFDPVTAGLIDTDKDGRIRAPELIAAVEWAGAMLKNPEVLMRGGDALKLEEINDSTEQGKQIRASAERILSHAAIPGATVVTLEQAVNANTIFSAALFNGDGIIVPECATEAAMAALIAEIADCVGSVPDRSGQPGIDQERVNKFFAAGAEFEAWSRQAEVDPTAILPAGPGTAAAAVAVRAVKAKVDDYFGRCRVAAFDPRALEAMNRSKEEYGPVAAHQLSIDASELASFPLAQVAAAKPLPLKTGINPAHEAAVAALVSAAIQPLLGERTELSEAEWSVLQARLTAFETWQAVKAGGAVEKLGLARVRALLAGNARETITALVAKDKALEMDAANVASVEKLVRYVRDLATLCRNFVNFNDLYGAGGPAIFQCGTLYLDQRACFLCLTVEDAGRHAAMAGLSGAYLAYCDCVRKGTGEKRGMVAIVSQGDDENLMEGRNGVFYDRKGRDYDATVTKIVASPVSLRQAFWSPYKKLARTVETFAAKRAAAANTTVDTRMEAAATSAPAAPPAPAPGATPTPPVKPVIDPAVIALLSVALGSLAAGAAAVLAFLGKVPLPLLPLLAGIIVLAVSTPSLIMAYLRLRKRNLGPILDANGWAINAKAKINIPFGEHLTAVAKLPATSSISLDDKYAEKPLLWPKLLITVLVVIWIISLINYAGIIYLTTKRLGWDPPVGDPPGWRHPSTNEMVTPQGTNTLAK